MKALIIASYFILAGCSGITVEAEKQPQIVYQDKIVYVNPKVVLPMRPTLPILSSMDFKCLRKMATVSTCKPDEEIVSTILERDRLRKGYAEDLEAILNAINDKSKTPN